MGSAGKIRLTGFSDLFQVPELSSGEPVQELPLAELHPFEGHPFQIRDDENMREMAESIAQHGVLVPGIVRPRREGSYEIVAGHRRKRGSELAGKDTMPAIVRELVEQYPAPRKENCGRKYLFVIQTRFLPNL